MLLQFIFWILQIFSFYFFFFAHRSFSTTLQFVLHNSGLDEDVCVFCVGFFVQCVQKLQNIRIKVTQNPIPNR